jgi:hypothetical protein
LKAVNFEFDGFSSGKNGTTKKEAARGYRFIEDFAGGWLSL